MFFSTSTIFASCCGGEADGYWFAGCCHNCDTWDPVKMGSDCSEACCTLATTKCPIPVPCTGELCPPGDDDDDDDKKVCTRCTLEACPNPPLSDTGTDEYKFDDFISCQDTGTCTDWHYKPCYEIPNKQPDFYFELLPDTNDPTTYGFKSLTHTGAGTGDDEVNDPIRMRAIFIDPDNPTNPNDIETMYIWFSKSTAKPNTPRYIDLNNNSGQASKTASKTDYGFLMHKEGSAWVPYIPSILGSSAGDKWVRAPYSNNQFSIKGPDGTTLVNISINSVSTIVRGFPVMGRQVDFNVSYNTNNPAPDGVYNIFGMANKTFGFTPYDNYDAYPDVKEVIGDYWAPEEIRYFDQWRDSNRDWNLDLSYPFFGDKDDTVSGKSKLTFSWDIRDNLALYGIVGNLYVDQNFKNVLPFTTAVISGGTIDTKTPYTPVVKDIAPTKTGYLLSNYLFRILGTDGTGTATIDVGENREGIIYLYLTGFDRAGNPTESSYISFDLRDWLATQGGFVYSKDGIDVTSRTIANTSLWDPIALIKQFDPVTADVSSELEADSLTVPPIKPDKSEKIDSYMVRPYKVEDISGGYYSILKNAFEKRRATLNVTTLNNVSELYGTLVTNGSTNIRYMDRIGSLTVGKPSTDFLCNGFGIFFVSEDLIINGKITNTSPNKDACIFVVKGSVIVKEGAHVSGSNDSIRYEPINAYILSDKTFTIEEESKSWDTTDGLYVGGGIHSLEGVSIKRYLNIGNRLQFPVFVVDHHSKYGVFAGSIFGTQSNVQKTEVGFKP